jgi:hypothetical protein
MLPLLQYALKESWALRQGNTITAASYARSGGVREAIRNTAERTFAALGAEDQQAARQLFLRLVTPGDGQEDTRARAAMPSEPVQRRIVAQFAGPRIRLLVTGSDGEGRPTVEAVHEALIRTWPRLRGWIDANREKLRARAAVLQAKAEWEQQGRREDLLLPAGFALERARALLADSEDITIDDIGEFIALSSAREKRLQRITRLAFAAVGAFILIAVATAGYLHTAMLREVQNGLMSEARTLSANVDREIVGEIEWLQALAASASLRQGDFAEFQRQAEASLALRQSGNIVLIDPNMQELVNTWVPFGRRLAKAAISQALVERSLATNKPQVTGLFIGSVTKRLMFSIIVPVQIDGENRYVLGRSQDPHALGRLVAANELPPGRLAAVADAAHHIVARSEQEVAFIGKELPPAQWHHAGPGGVFEFIDSEGRPSLEARWGSELTGWETAVWAPKALLEAPVRALWWWTIVLTASLAFMLVVGLALWLGRIIAHSVGRAARAAIALGEGGPNRCR